MLEVGKKLRSFDRRAQLLWLVPKHFKSCVYFAEDVRDDFTRSRGHELAMLRQCLLQRHVLLIHNIHSVDTERLLRDKVDQGLRTHLGSDVGHLVAYLHRLFAGNFARIMVTSKHTHNDCGTRLAEKCTILMHSRAYNDLCMPRPYHLASRASDWTWGKCDTLNI